MISLSAFISRAKRVPFLDKGRGFSGWDCWGLVYEFFRACKGIELPLGTEHSHRDEQEALAALQAGAQSWREIPLGQERAGDVALFRPCHVGVVTRRGWMLNARIGWGTMVERYDSPLWASHLIGVYRYE